MRTKKDLAKQYGGRGRNAVNRAIRAECPGSAELLGAMERLESTIQLVPPEQLNGSLPSIMGKLNASRDAMELAVLSRPAEPPTYSVTQTVDALGIAKSTVIQICKRHGIGHMVAGRVALTAADVLAVKKHSQGRAGAPAGNQHARKSL